MKELLDLVRRTGAPPVPIAHAPARRRQRRRSTTCATARSSDVSCWRLALSLVIQETAIHLFAGALRANARLMNARVKPGQDELVSRGNVLPGAGYPGHPRKDAPHEQNRLVHPIRFGDVVLRGQAVTCVLAAAIVIVWAISGPFMGFSDVWQLTINTGTTIITFLMVFIIQNTQNRDSGGGADQDRRTDPRATEDAHNSLLDLEELSEKDL